MTTRQPPRQQRAKNRLSQEYILEAQHRSSAKQGFRDGSLHRSYTATDGNAPVVGNTPGSYIANAAERGYWRRL
jgi:hypothetical protein